jgi:hypothetical protein
VDKWIDALLRRAGAEDELCGTRVPCVHDIAATAFYHFKVRMFTNLETYPAIEGAFIGIRFP